jgi:uncharacterized protein involved in exopolysaccharide biosynthesis
MMKFKIVLGTAILILGLVLCVLGIRILVSPVLYRASARVEVKHKSPPGVYDPWFIQTEFELIQSDIILRNAIEKLNLFANTDAKKVGINETLLLLRKRLSLRAFGEDILEISVIDKSPEEAARIANAIAERYCDFKTEEHFKLADYVTNSKTSKSDDNAVLWGETVRIIAVAVPPKSAIGSGLWLGAGTLLSGLMASIAGFCAILGLSPKELADGLIRRLLHGKGTIIVERVKSDRR